jgi:Flp pilus assembly CpaF family ATPase
MDDQSQKPARRNADEGREPRLIAAQLGRRMISEGALVEQITQAFMQDYHHTDELRAADTSAKRLKLILESANYIFSVESVSLSPERKAAIIAQVYSNLFGYGPLDPLFADERITTIAIEGIDKASVRYGHGELISVGPIFTDREQLDRVIQRLVLDAGADLQPDQPFMEVGLRIGERMTCVNLLLPPVVFEPTLDIRLHPQQVPTWDDLVLTGVMPEQAADWLQQLAQSPHGLLIVGEPESGKTTLLNRLLWSLPTPAEVVVVERAREMQLPLGMANLTTRWPTAEHPLITFGEQLHHAAERLPQCMVLDEVRADEPETIAPLLQRADVPRQIWSFRGATFAKRLQSALGMLARRADPLGGDALVRALYERLPFVIAVNRLDGHLRLWSIGEWQFLHSPDYPTFVPLMHRQDGVLQPTEATSTRIRLS